MTTTATTTPAAIAAGFAPPPEPDPPAADEGVTVLITVLSGDMLVTTEGVVPVTCDGLSDDGLPSKVGTLSSTPVRYTDQ